MAEVVRISDAEQLPVPSWKRGWPAELQQISIIITLFRSLYWHRCVQVWFDSMPHSFLLISLIFTYVLTHTNLMWLRSAVELLW